VASTRETLTPFDQATAIRALSPGIFEGDVPDGWQQGRGAFGGLVFGLLARAMESQVADPARILRALSGDIAGPVLTGPVRIEVETFRKGNNQSNLQARLIQGGELLAAATGVFSTARRATVPAFQRTSSERPAWEATDVVPVGPPFGPDFARAYEYRSTGPMPFSSGKLAETAGYIRERIPPPVRDAASMIGLLDAWWPTLFSLDETFRAVATISFTAELMSDPRPLDPEERLFYRSKMASLADGFFVELRELWRGEEIVGMNQQTFAVLK